MDEKTAAEQLTQRFIEKLRKAANEVLGDLETEYLPYIQPDLESNLRLSIIHEIEGWTSRGALGEYSAQKIRAKILEEHRAEIINELNQDLMRKIEEQEKTIALLQEMRRYANTGGQPPQEGLRWS